MEALEYMIRACVTRTVGLAAIFIAFIMVGLSVDLALATRVGGMLTLLLSGYLCFKAWHARYEDVQSTEVWIMLPKEDRPHQSIAQKIIARLLRANYLYYATCAAFTSVVFLAWALGLTIGVVLFQ